MNKKLPSLFTPSIIVTVIIFTIGYDVFDTVMPMLTKHQYSPLRMSLGFGGALLILLAGIFYVRSLIRDVAKEANVSKKIVAWSLFLKVLVWTIGLAIFLGLGFLSSYVHQGVSNV